MLRFPCCRKQNTLAPLVAIALLCTVPVVPAVAQTYRNLDVGQWMESLRSDDVRERWYATLALAHIGPEAGEAIPPLVELLADRSQYEYVRAGAAFALGKIGGDAERVVPVLTETLGSDLASVRRHSARALGRFGRPATSAVPTMLAQLRQNDAVFRIDLAEALWYVAGHERAIPFLAEQVRQPENPASFEAAEALGRLAFENSDPVVPVLIEALGSANADVARSAARSLGRLGLPAAGSLAEAAAGKQSAVRLGAVEAFAWMGPVGASGLIAGLSDPSPEVRRAAARGLGRLGPEVAAVEPALLRAVNDPNSRVRATAAAALKRLGKNGL